VLLSTRSSAIRLVPISMRQILKGPLISWTVKRL